MEYVSKAEAFADHEHGLWTCFPAFSSVYCSLANIRPYNTNQTQWTVYLGISADTFIGSIIFKINIIAPKQKASSSGNMTFEVEVYCNGQHCVCRSGRFATWMHGQKPSGSCITLLSRHCKNPQETHHGPQWMYCCVATADKLFFTCHAYLQFWTIF